MKQKNEELDAAKEMLNQVHYDAPLCKTARKRSQKGMVCMSAGTGEEN
jgi:hypothetical protein